MYKTSSYDVARNMADREKCAFGISVVDAYYYIGGAKELSALPVTVLHDYAEIGRE